MRFLPKFARKLSQIYSPDEPITSFKVNIVDGKKTMFDGSAPGTSFGVFLDHERNGLSTCILWEVDIGYDMGLHWHDYGGDSSTFETIIVVEGSIYFNQQEITINKGECLSFHADVPHSFKISDNTKFYVLFHPAHPTDN